MDSGGTGSSSVEWAHTITYQFLNARDMRDDVLQLQVWEGQGERQGDSEAAVFCGRGRQVTIAFAINATTPAMQVHARVHGLPVRLDLSRVV